MTPPSWLWRASQSPEAASSWWDVGSSTRPIVDMKLEVAKIPCIAVVPGRDSRRDSWPAGNAIPASIWLGGGGIIRYSLELWDKGRPILAKWEKVIRRWYIRVRNPQKVVAITPIYHKKYLHACWRLRITRMIMCRDQRTKWTTL